MADNSSNQPSVWESVFLYDNPHGTIRRTERLAVPGGWLYKSTETILNQNGNAVAVATTYVPNPANFVAKS